MICSLIYIWYICYHIRSFGPPPPFLLASVFSPEQSFFSYTTPYVRLCLHFLYFAINFHLGFDHVCLSHLAAPRMVVAITVCRYGEGWEVLSLMHWFPRRDAYLFSRLSNFSGLFLTLASLSNLSTFFLILAASFLTLVAFLF